jgi:hemerythrin-like metal-binding protein
MTTISSTTAPESLSLLHEYFEETTSRGVLLVDQAGKIQFANGKFYQFFHIDSDFSFQGISLVGCMDLIEQNTITKCGQEKFSHMMQPFCECREWQLRLFLKNGIWVSVSGKPMKNGGYVVSVTDITQTRQAFDSMKRVNRATIMSLADLAENRDHDTGAHVLKVARMTQDIAWELQKNDNGLAEEIDDQFMQHVALASILHDVGKVATPDRILLKPGPLDGDERDEMSQHPKAGSDIISRMVDLQEGSHYLTMASRIALFHHEKFDGSGYPHGISGEEIPLEARIVAVSDVFDALVSWRPYKLPWPEKKAVELIQDNAGTMFDPRVVEAFVRVIERRSGSCILQWSEEMSVGIASMDKDHQILISLVNQLSDSRQRQDLVIMELVMEELLNYTIRHFQGEEKILQDGNFPHFSEHKQEHQSLAQEVVSIRKKFLQENDPEQADELMQLLSRWLKKHILVEDKKYHKYFTKHGLQMDGLKKTA